MERCRTAFAQRDPLCGKTAKCEHLLDSLVTQVLYFDGEVYEGIGSGYKKRTANNTKLGYKLFDGDGAEIEARKSDAVDSDDSGAETQASATADGALSDDNDSDGNSSDEIVDQPAVEASTTRRRAAKEVGKERSEYHQRLNFTDG